MSDEELGFDLRVTVRDPKSGLIIKRQPYTMRAIGDRQIFERPVGSGNVWWKSGKPAGRWADGKFVENAPHVSWAPPETEDEKLAKRVLAAEAKNAHLEKELAAIRRDQKSKQETAEKPGAK